MKILKNTFVEEVEKIVDGEIVIEETYDTTHFRFNNKAIQIFEDVEESYFLDVLKKIGTINEEHLDLAPLESLVASCYIKIDNNQMIQNFTTFNEIKSKSYFKWLVLDADFITSFMKMIEENLPKTENSKKKVTTK